MDDDELRRGRPTSHVKFGEDVAILAGDGPLRRGDPDLLRAAGGPGRVSRRCSSCGGDGGRGDGRRSVRRRHRRRSRRRGAARSSRAQDRPADRRGGGRGPDPRETSPNRETSPFAGLPASSEFSSRSSTILDVTGSDEQLGKPHGSDERHGKVTYVSLFGLERRASSPPSPTGRRRSPLRRPRRHRRPEADRGLHLHQERMSNRKNNQRLQLGRIAGRPPRPRRRRAAAGRAGDADLHHRHDRRDRRPFRRKLHL